MTRLKNKRETNNFALKIRKTKRTEGKTKIALVCFHIEIIQGFTPLCHQECRKSTVTRIVQKWKCRQYILTTTGAQIRSDTYTLIFS